jgi:hypothetical protein
MFAKQAALGENPNFQSRAKPEGMQRFQDNTTAIVSLLAASLEYVVALEDVVGFSCTLYLVVVH